MVDSGYSALFACHTGQVNRDASAGLVERLEDTRRIRLVLADLILKYPCVACFAAFCGRLLPSTYGCFGSVLPTVTGSSRPIAVIRCSGIGCGNAATLEVHRMQGAQRVDELFDLPSPLKRQSRRASG